MKARAREQAAWGAAAAKAREASPVKPRARAMPPWTPVALLLLAVAIGFALRMLPCVRNPDFEFIIDGRYHQRLFEQVLATGRVAETDSLSNAPLGRHTADHLPVVT